MQDEVKAPTATQVIRAAIGAAGGTARVGRELGISHVSVSGWAARGKVPAPRVRALCALGGYAVTADQVLAAMERESAARGAR